MNTPPSSPRLRDAAVVLPLVGLFLLMPPVITLFVRPADVVGVPLIVAYLFGVWLALIVCAAVLGRRIAPDAAPDSGRSAASDPGPESAGQPRDPDRDRGPTA
ncbi:MAG: hypothetical protein M9907_01950 [Burkholderiaceae bacterium]|nr:hypothetical protein [Burkholderiaceae bacterium]